MQLKKNRKDGMVGEWNDHSDLIVWLILFGWNGMSHSIHLDCLVTQWNGMDFYNFYKSLFSLNLKSNNNNDTQIYKTNIT